MTQTMTTNPKSQQGSSLRLKANKLRLTRSSPSPQRNRHDSFIENNVDYSNNNDHHTTQQQQQNLISPSYLNSLSITRKAITPTSTQGKGNGRTSSSFLSNRSNSPNRQASKSRINHPTVGYFVPSSMNANNKQESKIIPSSQPPPPPPPPPPQPSTGMPFRNRFASAALISQQLIPQRQNSHPNPKSSPTTRNDASWDAIINDDTSFRGQTGPIGLVLNKQKNYESPNNTYIDSSYESFGLHSPRSNLSESDDHSIGISTITRDSAFEKSPFRPKGRKNLSYNTTQETVMEEEDEGVDMVIETHSRYLQPSLNASNTENEKELPNLGENVQSSPTIGPKHSKSISMSSRLASLFTSQPLVRSKSVDTKTISPPSQQSPSTSESRLKIGKRLSLIMSGISSSNASPENSRSKSTPKERPTNPTNRSKSAPRERGRERERDSSQKQEVAASPPRSLVSNSSSGYVHWPGTLDKHGDTVAVSSSSGSEFEDIDSELLDESCTLGIAKIMPKPQKEGTFEQGRISLFQNGGKPQMELTPEKADNPLFQNNLSPISHVADMKRRFDTQFAAMNDVPTPSNRKIELDKGKKYTATKEDSESNIKSPNQNISSTRRLSNEYNVSPSNRRKGNASESPQLKNINQDGGFNTSLVNNYNTIPMKKSLSTNFKPNMAMIDTSASLRRVRSAGREGLIPDHSKPNSSLLATKSPIEERKAPRHFFPEEEVPSSNHTILSEDALKRNDEMMQGWYGAKVNGANAKGYRGFLDKTRDVPNLIDDDTESESTRQNVQKSSLVMDDESDVFDGLSTVVDNNDTNRAKQAFTPMKASSPPSSIPFTKIKRKVVDEPKTNKSHRHTPSVSPSPSPIPFRRSDSRSHLSVDTHSIRNEHHDHDARYTSLEDHKSCDSSEHNSSTSSRLDLSMYAVSPIQVKRLVKRFRSLGKRSIQKGCDPSVIEDANKAFALFEMRSRIMETDIERGIDRNGGTKVVDDIVTTKYYQTSNRVRDAVIVSKAWRDGASPKDAFTANWLTRASEVYYIQRPPKNIQNSRLYSTSMWNIGSNYTLEKVSWVDDTEFSLLRCPSLGDRSMRGFEIFTVGDCQSLLLKLTNERCVQLRKALNDATSRQYMAEQLMREESELDDFSMMTNAEMTYLQCMEEVKTISKTLVLAENAFELVKDRIERLIRKYETLLERMDNDDDSVTSFEISLSKDEHALSSEDESLDNEDSSVCKERLARKSQRAELKAKIAYQEALMARVEAEKSKKEALKLMAEKQKELNDMQKKLDDLETKSAMIANEYEMKLQSQKLLNLHSDARSQISSFQSITDQKSIPYNGSNANSERQGELRDRIKAKFRERKQASDNAAGKVHQRLQFYERSLQAVQKYAG